MAKQYLGMRVDDELLGQVQSYARSRGLGKSAAIRELVSIGLGTEASRQAKMIGNLKKSIGEFFVLKAVGETLSLEKVKRKVVSVGNAAGTARKKEVVHA